MTEHSPRPTTALRVLAVIPTYNESQNIAALLDALFALDIPGFGAVVVDDDSPDGTSDIVDRLKPRYPGLRLVCRGGPAGRGLAGRDGFLFALEAGAEQIIEMDGDFSHQPRHIPALLAALMDSDMAVGSRMVEGGSDRDRPAPRQWLTRLANAYARRMLNVPVLDTNSGFRVYSRKALEAIDPGTLRSRGPSIVHEVLYRAAKAGLRIREIPIEFVDRKRGTSKLDFSRLAAGYFWILKIRLGL